MFRNVLFLVSALFLILSANGAGTSELTHCLKRRHKVKLLIQANNYCARTDAVTGECTRPYALHNIENVIKDYEITNGMVQGRDYEIAVIVHSSGGLLMLDPNAAYPHPKAAANQFAQTVKDLMAKGVKFYFCMNTARGMHVQTNQVIPGVEYVTAGLTALADFQSKGWTYVQP
jgi:intracellular sulfur oxidation DsrE/DsrF family protein